MTPEAELRRHENNLVIIGTGVIAFGLWSVVRSVLFIVYQPELLTVPAGVPKTAFGVATYIIIAVVLFIDLYLRTRIGISARAEGHGRDNRRYIGLAVFYVIMYAVGSAISVAAILYEPARSATDGIVSGIIDLTSLILLIQLIHSARYVRKERKKLAA
jgi:hypothetical protein